MAQNLAPFDEWMDAEEIGEEEAQELQFSTLIQQLFGQISMARAGHMNGELQEKLSLLAQLLKSIEPRERFPLWKANFGEEVLGILREDFHSSQVHALCYAMMVSFVEMTSEERDDPDLFEIYDHAVNELGFIEQIATELKRSPSRGAPVVTRALIVLTGICLIPRFAERVCQSGVLPALLKLSTENIPQETAVYSLISLTNLAIHSSAQQPLLEAGAIPVAIQLLRYLEASPVEYRTLDCGLSAAFLICRVVGTHEQGNGANAIHTNQLFMSKMHWIFKAVLDAGPRRAVIGSVWDPANIMMDVATLATSDRNKPLLKEFIPLIVDGMRRYHSTNKRLLEYSTIALYQLSLDPSLREEIQASAEAILPVLRYAKTSATINVETFQKALLLDAKLNAKS